MYKKAALFVLLRMNLCTSVTVIFCSFLFCLFLCLLLWKFSTPIPCILFCYSVLLVLFFFFVLESTEIGDDDDDPRLLFPPLHPFLPLTVTNSTVLHWLSDDSKVISSFGILRNEWQIWVWFRRNMQFLNTSDDRLFSKKSLTHSLLFSFFISFYSLFCNTESHAFSWLLNWWSLDWRKKLCRRNERMTSGVKTKALLEGSSFSLKRTPDKKVTTNQTTSEASDGKETEFGQRLLTGYSTPV